jgi:hypothetical protein
LKKPKSFYVKRIPEKKHLKHICEAATKTLSAKRGTLQERETRRR